MHQPAVKPHSKHRGWLLEGHDHRRRFCTLIKLPLILYIQGGGIIYLKIKFVCRDELGGCTVTYAMHFHVSIVMA